MSSTVGLRAYLLACTRGEYKTMAMRLSNLKSREEMLVERAHTIRNNAKSMERMVYDFPEMEVRMSNQCMRRDTKRYQPPQ